MRVNFHNFHTVLWYFSTGHHTVVWKLRKFTLTLFRKNFVKTTHLLNKLLKSLFHGKIMVKVNFSFFHSVLIGYHSSECSSLMISKFCPHLIFLVKLLRKYPSKPCTYVAKSRLDGIFAINLSRNTGKFCATFQKV